MAARKQAASIPSGSADDSRKNMLKTIVALHRTYFDNPKSRCIKGIVAFLFGTCIFFSSFAPAWATCSFMSGFSTLNITIPITKTVVAPRDLPVGAELTRFTWSPSPGEFYATCSGNGARYWNLSQVPGSDNIFPTNVPGVGVKITNQNTPFPTSASYSGSSITFYWGAQNLNYVFVKTGPVSYGTVDGASLPTVEYNFDSSLVVYRAGAVGSITFSPASCQTPDVTVPMQNHRTSEFSGIGSFTSSTGFNIALNNCPGGMTTIMYQVDAVTTILSSANSVVALDGSSGATGIGVQLLDNSGNPFPLGSPQTFNGYNSSTGGAYAIPLKARYYQTGSSIGPGLANTVMTFLMNYQ
ncbi:fimbrial protein [Cupriavidus metallidurans]|uniref:fimbrial protein n=1 Tax=Cupriavidus metallidurans TaxID=119219 RepID=UPI001BFC7028|nr:fimbrial protein [Cupriavidus metallidurans]QWC87162.1 type 1 fimbrial protein [Cupriavidus metallidurans]